MRGTSLSFDYDALGRLVKQTSAVAGAPSRVLELAYDEAGRRTQLTWPESGFHIAYDYRLTGELWRVRENGASSGVGVLASYAYDNLGRRTGVTRGNGTSTSYAPDGGSRLTQFAHDLAGTGGDVTTTLGYDGLSRIKGRGRSNDAYALSARPASSTSYLPNVLNQYQQVNGVTQGYDLNGNTTFANGTSYGYNALDQLVSAGAATLAYDPLGRLAYLSGANVRFETLGAELIDEVSATGAILRRYVHGPGVDEPIVWYEGSGVTDRRWLHADERGSIVAVSDGAGTVTATNRYDEYGVAEGSVTGRFGYTGQLWLPETGLYSYKARMYSAQLGRFLQTDPIGYAGGMNLYAYVGGDPVNYTDPTGLIDNYTGPDVIVEHPRWLGVGSLIGGGSGDGTCGTLSANAGFLQECIGAGGTAAAAGSGPAQGNVGDRTARNFCRQSGATGAFLAPGAVQGTLASRFVGALRAGAARFLGAVGALLSLSGDTPQPRRFRHYGYSEQAGNFAKGLNPGSFATTASGAPLTGSQAQSLLALPSRGSVPNAYYNVTVAPSVSVVGPSTVAPANGQPGGGIEYKFPNGTPPGSVGPPKPIPAC